MSLGGRVGRQNGKAGLVILLVLVALAVAMAVSNPQPELHRQRVAEALRQEGMDSLRQALDQQGGVANLDRLLGAGVASIANSLGTIGWRYRNYLVFSVLSLPGEERERWVTVGVLGNVFVL